MNTQLIELWVRGTHNSITALSISPSPQEKIIRIIGHVLRFIQISYNLFNL